MARYDIAIVVTIEAGSYDAACGVAEDIAAGVGDSEQISASAIFSYDRDNDGQRVLYLDSAGN